MNANDKAEIIIMEWMEIDNGKRVKEFTGGFTKREQIAIEITKQLILQKDLVWGFHSDLAPLAVRYADSLIAELNKK